MIERTHDYQCPECGRWRELTTNGALVCPEGHGRVLTGVTAKMLKDAKDPHGSKRAKDKKARDAKDKQINEHLRDALAAYVLSPRCQGATEQVQKWATQRLDGKPDQETAGHVKLALVELQNFVAERYE
jgi:DNA-directed RNA polymerase subunit RPC12/RpoP